MALVDTLSNITDIIREISPELGGSLASFVNVLAAAGIILIAYVIYVIVAGILRYKTVRRVKRIENKIDEMEEKLDKALGIDRDKDKKSTKRDKTKSNKKRKK